MESSMSAIMKAGRSFSNVVERGVPLQFDTACRNAQDGLALAGLDFTVESRPLSTITEALYAKKYFGAFRSTDGAMLGVNSSQFHQHQPEMLGVLADAVIQLRPDAYISAGGLSKDERTQFLVVTLNGEPIEGQDGHYDHNILLANGTNGNCMLKAVAFNFRFFCMNQFPAISRTGNTLFKLGHTWSGSMAIPTAIQAIQDATRTFDEMDTQISALLDNLIPKFEAVPIFMKVLGDQPEKEGHARTIWDNKLTYLKQEYFSLHNAPICNTAWGLVMAAQAVDEHGSKAIKGGKPTQRIQRVLDDSYPLMARTLQLVSA